MGLSNEYIIDAIHKHFANQITANTYVSKITKLSELLDKPIYDILKSPALSFNGIKTVYATSIHTQMNIVTMIMSIFKTIPELTQKKPKAAAEWRTIYEKLKPNMPMRAAQPPLTREEIDIKYKEMKAAPQTLAQEFLLLSMVKHMKVPKADFSQVYIVNPPARQSLSCNYIVLNDKPYLVLNKKRYYIGEELYRDIKDSLRTRPREYLFGPYEKTNSYNVFFIRAFERMFGKKVGVNWVKSI